MNLYLLHRTDSTGWQGGYQSAVVVAPDVETARGIHPSGEDAGLGGMWVKSLDLVAVKYLGVADGTLRAGQVIERNFISF